MSEESLRAAPIIRKVVLKQEPTTVEDEPTARLRHQQRRSYDTVPVVVPSTRTFGMLLKRSEDWRVVHVLLCSRTATIHQFWVGVDLMGAFYEMHEPRWRPVSFEDSIPEAGRVYRSVRKAGGQIFREVIRINGHLRPEQVCDVFSKNGFRLPPGYPVPPRGGRMNSYRDTELL